MAMARGKDPLVPENPAMFQHGPAPVNGTPTEPIPPETEEDDADAETSPAADAKKSRGKGRLLVLSPELKAMGSIEELLSSLDDGEQRRVMFWLCDKYEFYVTAVPKLEAK